jgi:hypothetical protein
MKKLMIFSVVAMGVILLGNSPNIYARNNKIKDNPGFASIHYQVTVHPGWKLTHNSCPSVVEIVDGTGMIIGLSQLYQADKTSYDFYEVGPVTGTRKAIVVNAGGGTKEDVCMLISLWASKAGTFMNGETYGFNIYESPRDVNVSGVPTVTQ